MKLFWHPYQVGHSNEEQLKAACLELSKDKKNFTRNPPPGVDFDFDYTTQYPVAMVTLSQDKQLEAMRFELVPAVLNEAIFWRNYFYRVSLISQVGESILIKAKPLIHQIITVSLEWLVLEVDIRYAYAKRIK